jgi:hypothetical protein
MNILENGFREIVLIFLEKVAKVRMRYIQFEIKSLHLCPSLCGPRVEGTILSRTQSLDISDHSAAISRPNKKIITFAINS